MELNPETLRAAVSLVLVAALWGCTNPFLKAVDERPNGSAPVPKPTILRQVLDMLLNWRFWVPFLINQSGSVLYNYLLGGTDISLASPICNSLALVFTGLTARALGERQPWNLRTALGMLLIVGGVGMCVVAKADTEAIKQASIAAG